MRYLVERPVDGWDPGRALCPLDGGDPVAVRDGRNPLFAGWSPPADRPAPDVVIWSGSLAEDPLASHPPNWMGPGRTALDELVGRSLETLEGGTLLLRPHRRHVLSDAPSAARFLDDHEGKPVGLALCPRDLLEDSMLEAAEDHLIRILERLGARCSLVYLEGLTEGILSAGQLRGLLAAHVDPATALVLGAEQVATIPAALATA